MADVANVVHSEPLKQLLRQMIALLDIEFPEGDADNDPLQDACEYILAAIVLDYVSLEDLMEAARGAMKRTTRIRGQQHLYDVCMQACKFRQGDNEQHEQQANGPNEQQANNGQQSNAIANAVANKSQHQARHATFQCQNCNHQLPSGAQFCPQCRTPTNPMASLPSALPSSTQKQCPHCTKILPKYQPYCCYCAAPTQQGLSHATGSAPCHCHGSKITTLPQAPFCGTCGHLISAYASRLHDDHSGSEDDNAPSDDYDDSNGAPSHMCPACNHRVLTSQPFCGFCGTLQPVAAKHPGKHSPQSSQQPDVPIKPTYVFDPARRICIDVHNPNIPGTEPPAYNPNPFLVNWKLPNRMDASEKARLQAIQTGLGLLYEAAGKGDRCSWPVNGINKPTQWGQLTTIQRAMATLEQELAFAAYTTSGMGLNPHEAKRRLGTANIPFPAAEQHATRKEVLELRRDAKAFSGGRNKRRNQPPRASSSSDDGGGGGGGGGSTFTDYPRGQRRGGRHRRGGGGGGDRRDRSRDYNRDHHGGDRNGRSRSRDRGHGRDADNNSRKVAGDAARSAMLNRIADLEQASRRRPGAAASGPKSGED